MERRYLEFREGTSDKFYRIIAVENQGQWITTVWWGRRGATGQTQLKYEGTSREAAIACMEDIANQKRAKGYHDALDPLSPAAGFSVPQPATPASPFTIQLSPASQNVPRFPAMKAREIPALDWSTLGPNFVMEEKFDGHRAGLTFQPDGSIVVRNVYGEDKGRIENMPHIEAFLRAVSLMRHAVGIYDGTLIDGELVGLTLEETVHLLGAGGRNDPRLRFVAFDLPFLKGKDLRGEPWSTRRGLLDNLLDVVPRSQRPVDIAELLYPSSASVEAIWARGGEGAILKPIHSKYVPGGRADWIKLKEHHTADAVITGWAPGNGKYSNQLGALKLSQYRNGRLVEVTKVSGMTDDDRASMTKNWPAWHGRVIEFEYQKKTADSYRHPRYVRLRPDKLQTDCTWEASA